MVASPAPAIGRFAEEQSPEQRDRIFDELNTLAVVYRQPSSSFTNAVPAFKEVLYNCIPWLCHSAWMDYSAWNVLVSAMLYCHLLTRPAELLICTESYVLICTLSDEISEQALLQETVVTVTFHYRTHSGMPWLLSDALALDSIHL